MLVYERGLTSEFWRSIKKEVKRVTHHEGDPGSEKPINYQNLSDADLYLLRGKLMQERGVEPVDPVDEYPVVEDCNGYFPSELFQGE